MSLLPVDRKIFETLVFSSLYKYLEDKLLSVHQSGFPSSDSYVNQLLSIIKNLYKASDGYLITETRGVFLDMSKAFDKVCHEEIIFKLKSDEISDSLLRLIESLFFQKSTSNLRQFLSTEISLKRVKIAFYFTIKTLPVLKIFKFLS